MSSKNDSNTNFIQTTVSENAINLNEMVTNKCTMSYNAWKYSPYVGASWN